MKRYNWEKVEPLEEMTIRAVKELNSEAIGLFLDAMYLQLDSNSTDFRWLLSHATREAEVGLTEEEIEIQDQKLYNSKSYIGRSKSYMEKP